ncbi:MAG: sensor histidine kinase [Spirosomataceae bacterium]
MGFSSNFIERYAFVFHLIGWAGFISLPFLFGPDNIKDILEPRQFGYVLSHLLSDVLWIIFFYFTLLVVAPYCIQHRTIWPLVASIVGVLLLMITLNYVIRAPFMMSFEGNFQAPPKPPDRPMPMQPPVFRWMMFLPFPQLFTCFFVVSISGGIALWRDHVRTQELHQQAIIDKKTAELEVLKLQISPHFLFNTLNNIRWLARQQAETTEDAIVILSQLLRYIIYQANHHKVSLEQEIEHLNNYILLQKMRLSGNSTVAFTFNGDFTGKLIEPLLFIPFVENAFKYGIHSHHPSIIRVSIQVLSNQLQFEVTNPIFVETTDEKLLGSGIGIANVQRRLQVHYPNQHQLIIAEENQLYLVRLTIDLEPFS